MTPERLRIEVHELDRMFEIFRDEGYRVIGPRLRDQAIVFDQIQSSGDLPRGWTDEQEKGQYRLRKREDDAFFGFNVGPHSWKQFLFVSREKLWSADRTGNGFVVRPETEEIRKTVFLGVRGCDLAAIGIQDRIFTGGEHKDEHYLARREGVFIVAVNCIQSGKTCFCVSMGTGPRVSSGYDLALTEVIGASGTPESGDHYFICESGTSAGSEILSRLGIQNASAEEIRRADELIEQTAHSMGRTLDTKNIKELIYQNLEHSRWDEVAQRCLSCANCTMVCPTCFCSSVEDLSDVTGNHTERWRRWDSCFTMDHSYLHGGSVHASVKSRYRQWMTHKLASWIDQFDRSGCVGCGRCITWCPVGIDITEETAAIRRTRDSTGSDS